MIHEVNTIGIIGAMDEEIRLLLEQMNDMHPVQKPNTTYYCGQLWGRRVVVCKSGVGKVQAAVSVQGMIAAFDVEVVLFTGVAGALDPSLRVGDIVVSRDCMYHDMDARALGFALGEIPFSGHSVFEADERLIQTAVEAGRRMYPELQVIEGRVVSGDQFIADRAKVVQLHEELSGACTEMEGAAVAHVCAMYGVPYVVVRSMSDQANGEAHEDFATFMPKAAKHSLGIIEGMLRG
jgi:adenosylhomocysteine nucleosidase